MSGDFVKELNAGANERVYYTGDLHLERKDEPEALVFLGFLKSSARRDTHLVILGDLFYFYFENRKRIVKRFRWLLDALEEARGNWASITLLHGNRDFFLNSAGNIPEALQVASDALVVIDANGHKTLVTHGDLFLQNDPGYFRFRKLMRSKFLGWAARNVWPPIGIFVADRLRWISFRKGNSRGYSPPDEEKMEEMLGKYKCGSLVFGHFHTHLKPGDFELDADCWCVPSWEQGSSPVLKYSNGNFELVDARELKGM